MIEDRLPPLGGDGLFYMNGACLDKFIVLVYNKYIYQKCWGSE